jgi:hypothetical protein
MKNIRLALLDAANRIAQMVLGSDYLTPLKANMVCRAVFLSTSS